MWHGEINTSLFTQKRAPGKFPPYAVNFKNAFLVYISMRAFVCVSRSRINTLNNSSWIKAFGSDIAVMPIRSEILIKLLWLYHISAKSFRKKTKEPLDFSGDAEIEESAEEVKKKKEIGVVSHQISKKSFFLFRLSFKSNWFFDKQRYYGE